MILGPNQELTFSVEQSRKLYVHQVQSTLDVDSTTLAEGDGAKIEQQNSVTFRNHSTTQTLALVFDLA